MEDELSIKKWFAEYVHSDSISMYGDVNEGDPITQNVFALLHSISHAFIKTAGELSGLSSNSLMEIILVETASIFIYAQSGQGLTLGALSGMIETNYVGFLKKAFADTRNCVFDPICTERDDTASRIVTTHSTEECSDLELSFRSMLLEMRSGLVSGKRTAPSTAGT